MVATVNRQLITHSDLLWQLALQPGTPIDEPRSEDLNNALQLLINQRLFHGEADRLPHIEPKDDEVEATLAALIRRFPSQSEFYKRIERVGLSSSQLRETVRERVEIEKYLDFRFRSFTIVSEKEVADYYRDAYVPRFRQRSPGRIVPKLEEARAEIERTLTEGKIESNINALLEDMRTRAESSLMPDSYLQVGASSRVRIYETSLDRMHFDVERGEVLIIVRSLASGETEAAVGMGELRYINEQGQPVVIRKRKRIRFHVTEKTETHGA